MEVELSLVVPTRNDTEFVAALAKRISDALESIPYELIFTDASDEPPRQINDLAESDARIRLVRLEGAEHTNSLAPVIIAGIRQASGAYIGILDANLQHPPELLPKLLGLAKGADIVVASRFLPGERHTNLPGGSHQAASQAGNTIARALFRRVRPCTDPLSGFFIFRREVVHRVKLRPKSTHILLELLVRGKWSRLIEIPYHAQQQHGTPRQASSNRGAEYWRHLRALIFQGEWGHGPTQYIKAGEDTMLPTANPTLAPERVPGAGMEQTGEVSPPSWRQITIQATGMWLASRVLLAMLTYYSALFQASLLNPNQNSVPRTNPVITPDLLLGRWLQWDATYYINIAHYGYASPKWTAFFPLYPAFIHLLTAVIGPGQELLAGMLISNLAALVAFIGLGRLVALEGGTRRAVSFTMLVLAAYPFAFFLAAPYTESIFFACAAWALFAARRGWWYLGIGCMLVGALCRPTGVILVLPLLYEFGRQHGWWQWLIAGVRQRNWGWLRQIPREHPWQQALIVFGIVATVPFALGVFAAICAQKFGDPLLFLKIHDQWNRVQLPIWTVLWRGALWQGAILLNHQGFWSYENARNLVDLMPVIIIGLITLSSVRRMPVSFTLYMLGLLYIAIDPPVHIGQNTVAFDSAGRFLLLSIPVFLLLGRWTARYVWLELVVVGGGFLLQAVFASYYLAGGWLI